MMTGLELRESTLMKIHVNRIPAEGLTERVTYDPAAMDMDRPDIHLREPFEIEALLALAEKELVVRADIRCPVHLTCARCLDEFTRLLTTDAVFSYPVRPTDVIDITDDVRQEIILAYPTTPLCRLDCKGLCSRCGNNLNHAPCTHEATEDHHNDPRRGGSIAL